ncbi:MAG: ComF family protein [Gammaproteobacteria bacterium]|nr:ComF family protein [Gammaproteobacteria bacterium]
MFSYECPVRALITAFKFHQGLPEGRVLASLFAFAMARTLDAPPDMLVPVPLHRGRLRERGYNQAYILAKALAKEMGIPVQDRGVQRVRDTAPQTEVGQGAQRHANVRGAFHCDVDLTGRVIGIVDDVITSGATIRSLGDALMACGADRVEAYSCARTPV